MSCKDTRIIIKNRKKEPTKQKLAMNADLALQFCLIIGNLTFARDGPSCVRLGFAYNLTSFDNLHFLNFESPAIMT